MAYCLQAFIGDPLEVARIRIGVSPIALPQGQALLPITDEARMSHAIARSPLAAATGLDSGEIPPAIVTFAAQARKIAYVEAEYFGGDGMQAAVIWEEGRLVFGPVIADNAINQALRILGVSKGPHRDEFDALELGRHRATEEWHERSATPISSLSGEEAAELVVNRFPRFGGSMFLAIGLVLAKWQIFDPLQGGEEVNAR